MAVNPITPNTPTYNQLEGDVNTARAELHARGKSLVDQFNGAGYTDSRGRPIKYNNIEEWRAAFQNGGVFKNGVRPQYTQGLGRIMENCARAFTKLDQANAAFAPMKPLGDFLKNGDIMGAMSFMMGVRGKAIDEALNKNIGDLNTRNSKIKGWNDQLAEVNRKLAANKDDQQANKDRTTLNGQIQEANNDTQTQMITVNDLVSKKNQTNDLLSGMFQKFSQALQGFLNRT